MNTEQAARMKQALKDNPGIGRTKLMLVANVNEFTAKQFLAQYKSKRSPVSGQPRPRPAGLSREEAKKTFDSRSKTRDAIKQGIAQLSEEHMYPEAQFKGDLCGSYVAAYWQEVSQEDEFLPYQVIMPGAKRVWGTPADVEWALGPDGITGAIKPE
jgi:hypothetical protein